MKLTNRTNLTAFDLIGYEGKMHIRIKGSRRGRATWETVSVKDGYTDGPVQLERLDMVTNGLNDPKPTIIRRSVPADTPVELLTKPVGLYITLPGDSWMFVGDERKQMHASGAIVEIVKVSRSTKTVTAWVASDLVESDEDVEIGMIGELDSVLAKHVLAADMTKDDHGFETGIRIESYSNLPKVKR